MMMSEAAGGSWARSRCGKLNSVIDKVKTTAYLYSDVPSLRLNLILQSSGGELVREPPSRSGGNYFSFRRFAQAADWKTQ
jgi:hypothetical protein